MDRELGRRNKHQYWLKVLKDENGYLLISTLFFLIFSGLFSHSVIKISSHQIIQLRQYSSAYQAKGALNMGEELLKNYVQENNDVPTSGKINTSVGDIVMMKESEDKFIFKITLKNGITYFKNVEMDIKNSDNKVEEETENIPDIEEAEQ